MSALARWCHRHRLVVPLLWVLTLAGLAGASYAAGGTGFQDSLSLPGAESTKAMDLVKQVSPNQSGATDTVVWHVRSGTVRDPEVRRRMTMALAGMARVPGVGSMTSPYDPQVAGQISADGRTAYAAVTYTKEAHELGKDHILAVVDLARNARTGNLRVELGGPAVSVTEAPGAGASELVGILAAAVVLLIAFGSFFAMLIPILTAVAALGTAILSMGLLSNAFTIATLAPTLGALIGLGVGIDYALFIITRFRSALKGGRTPEEATVEAVNTAGRAVIFAAGTVVIALLGMLVLGLGFLDGLAFAASGTVLLTMIAALTLVPALLGSVKTRALNRRERQALAEHGPQAETQMPGVWARWAGIVERRPASMSAVAVAVLAVLIAPFLALRLGNSDAGNAPESTTMRQAYDLLAEGFGPGFNGPLQLVARTHSAADQAALTRLGTTIGGLNGVSAVRTGPLSPTSGVWLMQVTPATSPQSEETSRLIKDLRDDVIPATRAGTGLQVYVGGQTAVNDDFADVLAEKLLLFVGVIVGLSFLLLLIAFRSLLIPLTAAVMNLMAATAAFGVIVALFQWGWLSEAMGLGQGPVEPFLPVLMLPVLFGLSMDYQVFLVSRMHEEWVHTGDNPRAVVVGQSTTGRVITAAAAIMIAVFSAFVMGGERVIAEFGLGLAAAVAIDAFILRTVLVPAVMHLFGRANWWLPPALDRALPHLSVEPPEPDADPTEAPPSSVPESEPPVSAPR